MPASRRQQLFDAIKSRFEAITTANGYETGLGARVFAWRDTATSPFSVEELANGPAANLRDAKRQTDQELVNKHHHTLSLNVEVAIAAGDDGRTIRKVLADLDKAIGVDRRWGGLAFETDPGDDTILVAQNGTTITGASYNFTVFYRTANFDPYNP